MKGARPAKVRFINWYVGKLHQAARHDARVSDAFLQVANLQAPPMRLLHPGVVFGCYGKTCCGQRSGDGTGVSPARRA